jgi:hypothetical protein
MFFGMFIYYAYDLHLKLDILNPLNIIFKISNGLKNESFALILKFLNDFVFHQVRQMNMYFHKRGHVFVVQKN